MESLIEIVTSPLMILFVALGGFALFLAYREVGQTMTREQKQSRNRKLRSEYGKKY